MLTSSPSMDILISSNLERLIYRIAGNDAAKNADFMKALNTNGKYEITPAMKEQLADFYGNYTSEEETAEEERKVQIVKSAIGTLSFSELEAMVHIFEELDGSEGLLVASKITDRVGITRSVIVNALRKFESAGIIESRSSGMKGTYIKVLNDVVYDEIKKIQC